MNTVVWGGRKNFISFLEKANNGNVKAFSKLNEALDFALKNESKALFLLPDYENSANVIEEFDDSHIETIVDIIKSQKTKIYIENYPSFDSRDHYIFGVQARAYQQSLGRNSIKLLGDFKDELGFELLQKRNGIFYQNGKHYEQGMEILAEIRNCLGVHDVVAQDLQSNGIALAKTKTNVYTAMVNFTDFDGNFTLPYRNWQKFYAKVFGEILSADENIVKVAFEDTFSGIGTTKEASYIRSKEQFNDDLQKCVLNSVNWHLNSGIMPNINGKSGVYEMIRSFDLKTAKNVRGDSTLFTAALFALAGKYFENPKWSEISKNISEEILVNRSIQIEEGENKGLLKWFSGAKDMGTHSVYASDSARGGNCMFALYKVTKDETLLKRLIMMGEAFLKWFSGDELLPMGWFIYDEWNLTTISTQERTTAPEFYEAVMILLKNIYSVTKDVRYKEQILKTAEKMADIYPNFGIGPSHSKNFTLSRALGIFAVAQSFESGKWTPAIDEILEYFNNLQHECGGFADGKAYFDENSLNNDMEFAIGFGPEHGNICDLMYCQNTMLYILNILTKCSAEGFNKALAEKMLNKSINFLLNVQIVSEDKTLSGGWMRAYDMDLGEYYGCDKDFAWGPYSILTGWMTGAIPITFLDLLGEETMY
ncbi:MAG: hypothetical protein J6A69_05085 [Clostridia bacterium]|nr:hypothetical protein [Clostridia bacterium]